MGSVYSMNASVMGSEIEGSVIRGGRSKGPYLQLLHADKQTEEEKLAAVIVSLSSGGSYDKLFTTVEQKSLKGTRVEVYKGNSQCVTELMKALTGGEPSEEIYRQLVESISQVDKDCVVFNWECCGLYGGQTFAEGKETVFEFLKLIIDRGHMAMFSDFSLKALIHDWDDHSGLGPNPFVKTGEYDGQFELRFNQGELK